MAGLFQGLEIGKRALLTHQLSMTVIAHNLSNVNTPGYTRQRAYTASATPIEMANFNIGNGVTTSRISHIRDLFLTQQYRRENRSVGEWNFKEKALSQIEAFFGEPNENGLGHSLDNFWGSWLALSNDPQSESARSAVVSNTRSLVNSLHSLDRQINDQLTATNSDIQSRVDQINQYTSQIANLNRIVVREELGGQRANDIRDQRDYLLDQLSGIVDLTTREEPNGSVSVFISGLGVVENADSFKLGTMVNSTGDNVKYDIVWEGTKSRIKITGGELKGLIDTRDEIIPTILDKLDQLAQALVTQVNSVHRGGFDLSGAAGLNFFDPNYTDAGNIRIDMGIESDPTLLAASQSGGEGDNSNALSIHDLRHSLTMSFGTTSISGFYNSMIGSIGVVSHEAKVFKGNYEALIAQIENSRQSVQGVSLDEEMAEMIKMQHAFNAAAKIITYMDDALGTLINGMGVVGR